MSIFKKGELEKIAKESAEKVNKELGVDEFKEVKKELEDKWETQTGREGLSKV